MPVVQLSRTIRALILFLCETLRNLCFALFHYSQGKKSMPYLSVQSNVTINDEVGLLSRLSQQVAKLLGKPESYVMLHIESDAAMLFAGSSEPLAFVQLKSLGLPQAETSAFSACLCSLLHDELGIDVGRIYIEFSGPERHMWGWNGSTF